MRHTHIPLRWVKEKEVIFRLLIWAKLRLMEKGLLSSDRFLFLSKCFQLDDKWAKFNALYSLHNGYIQTEIVSLNFNHAQMLPTITFFPCHLHTRSSNNNAWFKLILTKNVTLNFTTLVVEFAASSLNYWLRSLSLRRTFMNVERLKHFKIEFPWIL